jgi:hypothetical protein
MTDAIHHLFKQETPAKVWNIQHGLGIDNPWRLVQVWYGCDLIRTRYNLTPIDKDNVTIEFAVPETGEVVFFKIRREDVK